MRTILCITIILAGLLLLAVGCTDPEAVALARAREADARAREKAVPYAGEVALINAGTDATLERLSQLSKLSKEERLFDAQMSVQEFTTVVLKFRALELSIQEEVEAANAATAKLEKVAEQAEPIGHNAAAAAKNSWFTNIAIGGLALGLLCSTLLMMYSFNKLSKNG